MRKLKYLFQCIFWISLFTQIIHVRSWWLMAQMSSSKFPTNYCNAMPGLSRRQRTICFQHPQATRALHKGLRLAFDECRAEFAYERWNCSVDGGFGLALKMASAEVAFLYAITAGGVSHSLARECARGTIPDCSCGPHPRRDASIPPLSSTNPHTVMSATSNYYSGISASANSLSPYYPQSANLPIDFTWAGCSDNVKYANSFSRKFIDSTEKQHMDARALMNLHNNRVGRKALASNVRRQCKCHGVSGSCVTKTCWSVVPTIDEFGAILKKKYERAQQVVMVPDSIELMRPVARNTAGNSNSKRRNDDYSRQYRSSSISSMVPYRTASSPASQGDLVYLDASPDYCVRDEANEVHGTSGRECTSIEACTQLCCGRGWHVEREFRQEPCRCHFIWCCEVKCDMCVREVERMFCK